MTEALSLLFDDCLSKHATAALASLAKFSRGTVKIAHLADLSLSGKLDQDWVPEIVENGFLAISTDRGKKPSRGKPLPYLCRNYGVTHVLMTGAVHQMNQFDKIRILFFFWPELIAASQGPRGQGYLLKKSNHGRGFEIKTIDYRGEPQPEQPKDQQFLPQLMPDPPSPPG